MNLNRKVELMKFYFVALLVLMDCLLAYAAGAVVTLHLNPLAWPAEVRLIALWLVALGLWCVFIRWDVIDFLRRHEHQIRAHLTRRSQQ